MKTGISDTSITKILFFLTAIMVLLASSALWATPEFAEKTQQECMVCHVDDEGGELTDQGRAFAASGYVWPPKKGRVVFSPIRKWARFVIGALHIIAAFMWFGTILYVHLILRPGYASRGLPKGEVILGMVCMIVVGVTGVLLTLSRIGSFDVLYNSAWGIALLIKIGLYLIMIMSACFAVFFVGPRLKTGMKRNITVKPDIFDPQTLSIFDGKEGMSAYVGYKDKVYDVSGSRLWKDGQHMKHLAGQDLSDSISRAPHGEEKLEGLPIVGKYDSSLKPPKTFTQKAFYFVAYMNLVIVFLVLLVLAYWRWGT